MASGNSTCRGCPHCRVCAGTRLPVRKRSSLLTTDRRRAEASPASTSFVQRPANEAAHTRATAALRRHAAFGLLQMNPDGTFVDEDGAAEDYHVTDVSENDRKRLHYLKKQQRKKDHGKKHRPRHRGPAPAPGGAAAPRAAHLRLKHYQRMAAARRPSTARARQGEPTRAPARARGDQERAPGAPEEAGRRRRRRAPPLRQTVAETTTWAMSRTSAAGTTRTSRRPGPRDGPADTRCRAREFVDATGGGCAASTARSARTCARPRPARAGSAPPRPYR